ncbi:hypothetical protein B0H15DRAFT_956915 [Mycena belliarum]|uniref:Uncharacterized protein n=1 Tax=Mycena belliarum TaxID=1033014 RepID=A0AAD6TQV9_9AGAR|nr:hypothetical protein B0H15DRAFT_956915 [Mycena belliae]
MHLTTHNPTPLYVVRTCGTTTLIDVYAFRRTLVTVPHVLARFPALSSPTTRCAGTSASRSLMPARYRLPCRLYRLPRSFVTALVHSCSYPPHFRPPRHLLLLLCVIRPAIARLSLSCHSSATAATLPHPLHPRLLLPHLLVVRPRTPACLSPPCHTPYAVSSPCTTPPMRLGLVPTPPAARHRTGSKRHALAAYDSRPRAESTARPPLRAALVAGIERPNSRLVDCFL